PYNHLDLPSFPTRRSSDLGYRGSWRNDGDAVGKGAPGPGCRRYLHARCIETFPTRTHRRKKHSQFTRRHRAIEDATALAIDLWADRKSTRLNSSHVAISYA